MDPIEILMNEHGLIRNYLDNLTRAVTKLENGERPSRAFFEKAVLFSREFADKFHHFKEEYLMFGLLALKKGGAFDGPIGSLRYQHERCRACIEAISNLRDGYSNGDGIATTKLLENLAAYISLLRRHIHERDLLFLR